MILSANAIKDRLIEKTEDITSYRETIFISNFNEERLNPNSYNLKLQDELLIYDEEILDMRKENSYHIINIPTEGILLKAGELYLGRTVERTITNNLVPMLEGRSSIGRLGIFIHVTAGFGDIGFGDHSPS